MDMISTIKMNPCEALVDALRAELGGVLAERVIEAEAADFLWDSRVRERYLGQYIDAVDDGDFSSQEVSRIVFLSFLDGRWHAGICLVDGEGSATELLWKQTFWSCDEAEIAYL